MSKDNKKEISTDVKKELMWSSASVLMADVTTDKQKLERKVVLALSDLYDLPPQGINIMGSNPYINNLGLTYKLYKYCGQVKEIETELLKPAHSVTDDAIAKTTIILMDGSKFTAYGTASPRNIKMSTVKSYQNEMAETRSYNRCVRKIITGKMYEDFLSRIKNFNKDQAKDLSSVKSLDLGRVSAEEMPMDDETIEPEMHLKEKDLDGIRDALVQLQEVIDLPEEARQGRLEELRKSFASLKKSWNKEQVSYVASAFEKVQTQIKTQF